MITTLKTCFKCGAEKPRTEFYKHNKSSDGLLGKCKECTKADVNSNRSDNIEYFREFDRNRKNHTERVAKNNTRNKTKYEEDPSFKEKVLSSKASWIKSNPEKRKAQVTLGNAVRDKKVHKPSECESCFATDCVIYGHHWSYSSENWLNVFWLCAKCHGREHHVINEIERNGGVAYEAGKSLLQKQTSVLS